MLVTPNLNFAGECADAIGLYEKAFQTRADFIMRYADANPEDWNRGLTERQRNYVYHAEMKIGPLRFMFSDIIDFAIARGNAVFMTITFDAKEEVVQAFDVLQEGGEILVPLRSTTYSSCAGTLIDKFSIRWGLMTEQTNR